MVYGPLVTAFEQVYTETSTSDEALQGANAELISLIEGLQRAEEPPTNEGYRTVEVNFTTDGSANYRIVVDGVMHSLITVDTNGTSSMLPYDSCQADGIEMQGTSSTRTLPLTATRVVCTLTGMVPNVEHEVVIEGDEGAVFSATLSTGVGDVDTSREKYRVVVKDYNNSNGVNIDSKSPMVDELIGNTATFSFDITTLPKV